MSPTPTLAETLEPRTLFAASVHLDAEGVLRVTGTDHADRISVDRIPGDVRGLHVVVNGETHTITGEQVNALRRIIIDAGGGHDRVALFALTRIYFTGESPVMPVPRVPVVVLGGEGHDLIDGASTNDTFRGGPGRDTLAGGSGADRLFGGAGDDVLTAGSPDGSLRRTFSYPDKQRDLLDGGPGLDQAAPNEGDRTRSIEIPDEPNRSYILEGHIRTDVGGFDTGGPFLDFEGDDDLNDGVHINLTRVHPDRTVPVETGPARVTGYFQHYFGLETKRWLRSFQVTSLTYI